MYVLVKSGKGTRQWIKWFSVCLVVQWGSKQMATCEMEGWLTYAYNSSRWEVEEEDHPKLHEFEVILFLLHETLSQKQKQKDENLYIGWKCWRKKMYVSQGCEGHVAAEQEVDRGCGFL